MSALGFGIGLIALLVLWIVIVCIAMSSEKGKMFLGLIAFIAVFLALMTYIGA